MSSYTSFAVVGFGVVGSLLATEFVESKNANKYKLRVLTRSVSPHGPSNSLHNNSLTIFETMLTQTDKLELKALSSKGVDIIPVDYSSQESIAKALEGAEVVFSALRDDGLDIQTNVVRASKDADVKLFVPSEYGRNTIGDKSDCASHLAVKWYNLY